MEYVSLRFQEERKLCQREIEAALKKNLSPIITASPVLGQCIYDCVLDGGQRLRPILLLKMAELLGQPAPSVLKAACAVEILHSTSLILDDLPTMDNATMRRGKPTAHLVYGEANVIMISHLLAFRAYHLIVQNGVENGRSPQEIDKLSATLLHHTGLNGVIGGQIDDLADAREHYTKQEMETMYYKKTGALLVLTAVLANQLCQATPQASQALINYAQHLGIAYQIRDDILDETGELQELGKHPHQDDNKQTHTKLVGLPTAKTRLKFHLHKAEQSLAIFGQRAWFLSYLCQQYGAIN